jgi:hypothetical protein
MYIMRFSSAERLSSAEKFSQADRSIWRFYEGGLVLYCCILCISLYVLLENSNGFSKHADTSSILLCMSRRTCLRTAVSV